MKRVVTILVAAAAVGGAAPASAATPAPGAPGAIHTWAPADKHGFGTAHQPAGNAYFTLRASSLSEVYFPDLSTPSFRGLQFAITDGRTFTDREVVDDDPRHVEPVAPGVRARVEPVPGSLAFRQVTETARWRLTKTWTSDPSRPTVLAHVRFESRTHKPLKLYVLADPAPGDDGNDDTGTFAGGRLIASDDAGVTTAVAADPPLAQGTSGYRGSASDPWRELEADRRLTGYDATAAGNVVQAALTRLDGRHAQTMTLAIGFGADRSAAGAVAGRSLASGFSSAARSFAAGWARYRASLDDPPRSVAGDARLRRLYEQSLLVLAASEDKQNPGASIAAPNMPWIWGTLTLEPDRKNSGPYHLVWPRDLYHVATALQSAGDHAGAQRLLDYLWRVQKTDDGSFWQNTFVNGREKWTGTQLDEVALPIVLAWWLDRRGADDFKHVRAAAEFVAKNGPRTPQERWENQDGFSPNTIATEIAGLICAADIAHDNGADEDAERYRKLADEWQQKVEGWTATTNGPYSPRPYYLRLSKEGTPDAGTEYNPGDNHPKPEDERKIVDQSFLGLVLFGAKRFDDPTVQNSLAVGDDVLGVDTPIGTVWHRFTFDGYGEQTDGGDWDLFAGAQTRGRLWPLLAGERGEYELLAGRDARPRLRTIAGAANDGLMLPEQVWDTQSPSGSGTGGQPSRGERAGTGTRSGTPLLWTHAQFVRLAWSIDAGKPVERPAIVACRYTSTDC
jgi:glucoamylase